MGLSQHTAHVGNAAWWPKTGKLATYQHRQRVQHWCLREQLPSACLQRRPARVEGSSSGQRGGGGVGRRRRQGGECAGQPQLRRSPPSPSHKFTVFTPQHGTHGPEAPHPRAALLHNMDVHPFITFRTLHSYCGGSVTKRMLAGVVWDQWRGKLHWELFRIA